MRASRSGLETEDDAVFFSFLIFLEDSECFNDEYMGLAHCIHGPAFDVDKDTKRAKNIGCEFIEVKLTHQKEALSDSSIIATLLHEFAHATTDFILKKGVIDELGKKKSRKFREEHHGIEFYQNYKRILQTAEAMGIFEIPHIPDKFSARNLSRFDNIDISNQSSDIGHVLLASWPALQQKENQSKPCRIAVKFGNKSKLVILEEDLDLQDIVKMLKNKMNLKGKFDLYRGEEIVTTRNIFVGEIEIEMKKAKTK